MGVTDLVPDVVDAIPPHKLEVKYGTGYELDYGNIIKPAKVKNIPSHISWPCDQSSFYTLLFVDPDAPSKDNPRLRSWNHWMVVNIPGNDLTKGETFMEYIGSGPPKGSGLHRYSYIVYKQPRHLHFDEPKADRCTATSRSSFNCVQFAKKYNLELIAGNFYLADYDVTVDDLHKQLNLH